jgi:mRNA interferase MazF
VVARGDLWWANLGRTELNTPAWRPVVVISADSFNRSKLRTVTVLAISSNPRLGGAPGNVILPAGTAGLDRDAVINVCQVITLDRGCLEGQIGSLSRSAMARVESGVKLALGM